LLASSEASDRMEPYTFSWSELDTLRQCPMKWGLAYLERWQRATKSPALQRGTDWHQIQATFWGLRQRGVPWNRASKLAWKEHCIPPDGTTQTREQLLLEWMLLGYAERWAGDQDWEILGVEIQHEVPITRSLRLKVRADLIVRLRTTGRIFLVDSKTGKELPTEQNMVLHPQFGLYTWALRRVGIPVWGSIHDGVRTQRNKVKPQPLDERFRRVLIHHTDEQLATLVRDASHDIESARRLATRLERRADRRSLFPDDEFRVDMPRHFDASTCSWRCDYLSACLAGARAGRPERTREFLRDLSFEQHWERH
jgi:RecB family exonuclease